jgi:hypothetical protein
MPVALFLLIVAVIFPWMIAFWVHRIEVKNTQAERLRYRREPDSNRF